MSMPRRIMRSIAAVALGVAALTATTATGAHAADADVSDVGRGRAGLEQWRARTKEERVDPTRTKEERGRSGSHQGGVSRASPAAPQGIAGTAPARSARTRRAGSPGTWGGGGGSPARTGRPCTRGAPPSVASRSIPSTTTVQAERLTHVRDRAEQRARALVGVDGLRTATPSALMICTGMSRR